MPRRTTDRPRVRAAAPFGAALYPTPDGVDSFFSQSPQTGLADRDEGRRGGPDAGEVDRVQDRGGRMRGEGDRIHKIHKIGRTEGPQAASSGILLILFILSTIQRPKNGVPAAPQSRSSRRKAYYHPSADDPLTSADHPLTSADDPLTPADDPLTSADHPLTSADHPLTSADDPLTSADDPLTPADQPLTSADHPLTSADDPFPRVERRAPVENIRRTRLEGRAARR